MVGSCEWEGDVRCCLSAVVSLVGMDEDRMRWECYYWMRCD